MNSSQEYMRQYKREHRKRCKEKGICIHCCSRLVTKGFTSCEGCREYARTKIRNNRKFSRPPKPTNCPVCGKAPEQFYWHHWGDSNSGLGMWVCPYCNIIVELEDRGLVDIYRQLKISILAKVIM